MATDVKKTIDALNKARSMELTAISQYMSQHYALDAMDYGTLCGYAKLIAIDEMRHAEKFSEYIISLDGEPTGVRATEIVQPQTVQEMFPFDVNMEADTVKTYGELAEICRQAGELGAVSLFQAIIKDERVHLDYYKATASHIKNLGDAFLAKYVGTSKKSGPIKSFVKVMEKEDF